MGSRRRAREFALQALYNADISDQGGNASLSGLWAGMLEDEGLDDTRPPESPEVEFAQRIVLGVEERRDELDGLIEACSTNWRIPRMPVVDRNILRLSTYELLFQQDTPANVVINEAVELAKCFGTKDSKAFVNGILDRIARDLGRL